MGFFKSFSNHYLVGLCLLKPVDMGPKPWRFPSDLLSDEAFCAQVELILSGFDKKDPMVSWEKIKLKVQSVSEGYSISSKAKIM